MNNVPLLITPVISHAYMYGNTANCIFTFFLQWAPVVRVVDLQKKYAISFSPAIKNQLSHYHVFAYLIFFFLLFVSLQFAVTNTLALLGFQILRGVTVLCHRNRKTMYRKHTGDFKAVATPTFNLK